MAGYKDQELYETRQGAALEDDSANRDPGYDDYDDGFEDPEEESGGYMDPDEEEDYEEDGKQRFRILSGVSNVTATIIGAVVILVLVYLLVSMARLVADDLGPLFSNL